MDCSNTRWRSRHIRHHGEGLWCGPVLTRLCRPSLPWLNFSVRLLRPLIWIVAENERSSGNVRQSKELSHIKKLLLVWRIDGLKCLPVLISQDVRQGWDNRNKQNKSFRRRQSMHSFYLKYDCWLYFCLISLSCLIKNHRCISTAPRWKFTQSY